MMRALPFGRFSHLGASCGSARTLGSAHEELPGRTHFACLIGELAALAASRFAVVTV